MMKLRTVQDEIRKDFGAERWMNPTLDPFEIRQRSKSPWVLHIDDDVDFSDALRKRLGSQGVVVVCAVDGQDGLECVEKYPPDAIILDYSMPRGCGDEILRELKTNPATAETPVIVLTCNHGLNIKRRMMQLGAAEYLTKPLRYEQLHQCLDKYIDILPM